MTVHLINLPMMCLSFATADLCAKDTENACELQATIPCFTIFSQGLVQLVSRLEHESLRERFECSANAQAMK